MYSIFDYYMSSYFAHIMEWSYIFDLYHFYENQVEFVYAAKMYLVFFMFARIIVRNTTEFSFNLRARILLCIR